MNVHDFDRILVGWLDDARPTSEPDGLLESVTARVRVTHRRREWLIGDRWTWSARLSGLAGASCPVIKLAVLVALLAALAAGLVLIGSARPAPPFGLTRSGYLTVDSAEGIVVARADGSDRHTLVPAGGQVVNPSWSHDGRHLAFWQRRGTVGGWTLVVVEADGTGRTELADGISLVAREATFHQPSNLTWSPDDRRIAFAADTPSGSAILVADRIRSGVTRITDPLLQAVDPAWSPDGSVIAFESAGTTSLHLVAPDGTGEHELTGLHRTAFWPDWSPDGRLLAVAAESRTGLDIFTISTDGSQVTNVSDDPADEYSPSWSPDGSRLAWARAPTDRSARAWVVVTGPALGRATEIRVPADLAPPVWSPDGTRIYSYVADTNGTFHELVVLDPDGREPVVRIPTEGNLGNGSWQRLP